jgi:thiol-disulfide isomerase/thioredoxin
MRRSLLALALSFGTFAAPLAAPVPAVADDGNAGEDWKAITDWLDGQKPKDAEERKQLRTQLTAKLRGFLKVHPDAGKATLDAKYVLSDVLAQDKSWDAALALFEDLAKSKDEKYAPWAKAQIVRALMEKHDYAQARTRLDALAKELPGDENVAKLDAALKQREGVKKAAAGMQLGAPPPALKGKTVAGADFSLDDWKGKVVLVDFWATWCPPCAKELPNLKALYAELHGKGFEIVGIDGVEKDPAKLTDFIAAKQIAWPQLAEDGKRLSRDWGVTSLPRLVLLGKDGNIAALDLRGDRLAKAVRALVAGKPIPPEVLDPSLAKEKEGEGEGEMPAGKGEGGE